MSPWVYKLAISILITWVVHVSINTSWCLDSPTCTNKVLSSGCQHDASPPFNFEYTFIACIT